MIVKINCKNGFIETQTLDSSVNPNNPVKSNVQLNSFSVWYRLNGTGRWVHKSDFRTIMINIIDFRDLFSADEIWNYSIIKS